MATTTKQLLLVPHSDVAITIPLQQHLDAVGHGAADDDPTDNYLPTHVDDETQLDGLPDACRSFTNPARPLRHVDLHGIESTYVLRPMRSVVWLILIVEAMERFAYYGVYYTQTLYLTGVYNEDWNAGLSSIEAASYVSLSTAVAYSTPFLGAYLADAILGDYWTIALAGTTLYLPGLALMALTSVPHLLGSSSFNRTALGLVLFVLWPAGAGSIKSCVNIFGARQFHPLLQRDKIESYYVHFYTSINVGALLGITMLPIVAQWNVTVAYVIPVALLASALALFLSGIGKFVISRPVPRRSSVTATRCCCGSGNSKNKRNQGTSMAAVGDDDDIPLSKLFRISLLIVPFCMAYSQMPTTLIVQGTVMDKAFGFLDAATINSVDALSVLLFGYLTATYLYPALSRHNVELYTTHKFALGSFLGALSILWALVVDYMIRSEYDATGQHISVLWQAPSYILIGCGEIFAVSAAYEVAFTASSPQTKALASAINIFCVGGIPNLLCVALYHACRGWFRNAHDGTANISHLEQYVTARVDKYFWVLVTILSLGMGLNLAPRVRDFVQSIEKRAEEIVKTPLLLKRPSTGTAGGETTPLLRKQFLQSGPSLYRASSIHAGPSRGQQQQRFKQPHNSSNDPSSSQHQQQKPKIKASYIQRLYKPMNNSRQPQQIAPQQQQPPATPKRHFFTAHKTHHHQQQQQQQQPHASSLERGDSM